MAYSNVSSIKLFLKPTFLVLVICYVVTKYLKVNQYPIHWFFKNYFTDLICMPITLLVALVLLQIIKRSNQIKLDWIMIFGLSIFYAVFFEIYAPNISTNFTADFYDAIMYFVGSIFFWFWQKLIARNH